MIPKDYSTPEFEEKYSYYKNDLGAVYSKEQTAFRLWAPVAERAEVRLYKTGNPDEKDLIERLPMRSDENGTWVVEKYGDLNGVFYTFAVIRNGEEYEAADPYGKACGVNGIRSMVIDLKSTDPEGWEADKSPWVNKNFTDAVLYELHVRDLSSDESSGIKNKGKFLGVVENGTKTSFGASTGIDHIKELGITHVHFLPCYDYGSVDESKPADGQFNWGYDPVSFNVPEGSYATNAEDGFTRVRELKEMVKGMHENGLGVVFDVVYNHVYKTKEFCFNVLVPGYYSRQDENWNYSSASGCGNDTASERSMVRKYIVDSVKYWADEYHADGFRFDLSGLLDVITLNEIFVEVRETHPHMVFYCEGWDMPTAVTKPGVDLANQYNSEKMPGFAFFSDTIRDMLCGKDGSKSLGFATGEKWLEPTLRHCFMGMPFWCKTPYQSINYVSCHDGHTLFDRITLATPNATFAQRVNMNKLTAAIYLLSQGIPLMQAGEEMLRSKPLPDGTLEHNSYNCSDFTNSIKWDNLKNPLYRDTFEYYKGIIAFRKAHGALRMTNARDVYSHITIEDGMETGTAAFHIWGNVNGETAQAIYVIFNATENQKEVELPVGEWQVCIDQNHAGTDPLYTAEGKFTVPPVSATVMIK